MSFLTSKRNLLLKNRTSFQWGKTFLWDVQFPDAPEPFNEWFPATDVSINTYTMELKEWEFYLSSYSVPMKTAEFDMSITYSDDARRIILDFFSDWVNNTILDGELSVLPLRQAVRPVNVLRLNDQRETLRSDTYWVFPANSGNFEADSESSIAYGQVELKIAGVVHT